MVDNSRSENDDIRISTAAHCSLQYSLEIATLTLFTRNDKCTKSAGCGLFHKRKKPPNGRLIVIYGGEGGIRTHGRDKPSPVFKTGTFGQLSHLSKVAAILHDKEVMYSLDLNEYAHIYKVVSKERYSKH